jgi:hypothetical protein
LFISFKISTECTAIKSYCQIKESFEICQAEFYGGKVNKNKAKDGNIKKFKFFSSLLNIADSVNGVENIIKKRFCNSI